MAYTTAEGRQQLLDTVAEAVERLGQALALLGVAYEELDESRGDQLEALLFRPVQGAYGRLRRTHSDFATRAGLPARTFTQPPPPAAWHGSRSLVEEAAEEVGAADDTIADLQDSLLPVEVGDPELRAGLAGVRELLTPLQDSADELLRQLWR
ncbi:hypothetical protein Q5424_12815 [Conexibacter sp. JD483]|uniref:hypothetical protein n=1 Tax=unclassified Conexibacter TaxID=2627773 RepID=UPI002719557F|nr:MULTISPECIES: hypothetical protein [unclassified Conexibacter]MDO8187310.1 hypothetical protein [Conexibacter sp. CPCC 205706]MDO8200557.1 hypothetical protein [Conexibacter sp. CPCC 205762]MDR9369974.1 hypothetical protein [Conexibacter sp. JD483]